MWGAQVDVMIRTGCATCSITGHQMQEQDPMLQL